MEFIFGLNLTVSAEKQRINHLKRKQVSSSPFIKRKTALFGMVILLLLTVYIGSFIYGLAKPLPEGLSYEGTVQTNTEVRFLKDITYHKESRKYKSHQIMKEFDQLVDRAEEMLLVDSFLYNDRYPKELDYPHLANHFTNKLLQKKAENPNIRITVLTDKINTFYGSYSSPQFDKLEAAGVQVVFANTSKLKDANPLYTSAYRAFIHWWGTPRGGWIPSPFQPDSTKVTARSYLDALNLRANHRKLIMSEKEAIITSANIHDPSSHHSNIGFHLKGDVLQDITASEKSVIRLSGGDDSFINIQSFHDFPHHESENALHVQLLTESKIKKHLLAECYSADEATTLWIGVFLLSDRDLIDELLHASERGTTVNIILDGNKSSYGREKNGVPNRPVADELLKASGGKINVRWYNTTGEQFHSKLLLSVRGDQSTAIGGSTNFTKKNLDDRVFETDIKITGSSNDPVLKDIEDYFTTLWKDEDKPFTSGYDSSNRASTFHYWLYRFQEATGISTF